LPSTGMRRRHGWRVGRYSGPIARVPFSITCCNAIATRELGHNARSVHSSTTTQGAEMVTAVYPGTFDPLTRGHEDLVRRASGLFDKLIVGVAISANKRPFFSLDERLLIANEVLGHYPNVQVESFSGLLKDFVRSHDARLIVRGLRTVSDFEYEF